MIRYSELWSIFPVQTGNKKPIPHLTNQYNQGGFYVATNDENQLALWEKTYPGCNWALRTGTPSGCWVLDIDVKNGAKGKESFIELVKGHDFPFTLAVSTPTGGLHYYFEMEPGIKNRINVGSAGGIDIKADGAYVVIPPSIVNGNKYAYLDKEAPIARTPDWLKAALFPPKNIAVGNNFIPDRLPQKDTRAESISAYLYDKYLPQAITGRRNATLMNMLCQMRDNIVPYHIAEGFARKFVEYINAEDFPLHEGLATLRSVYARQKREPSLVNLDVQFDIKETSTLKNVDEAGIADYILYKHKNIVYVQEKKAWGIFREQGYWDITNADGEISNIIVDELRALSVNENYEYARKLFKVKRSNIEDIMFFLKRKVAKSYTEFNNIPYMINCKNGVINLQTLELTAHAPEYFFDYVLDVNYDVNAKASLWIKFLKESLEDAEFNEGNGMFQLEVLQLYAGYSITGETNEECLFYVWGATRSGKSTFITLINEILGPLAGTIQMNTLMQKQNRSDFQNFDLASLVGKRFVISSETDKETYLDSARMKALTGRDTIKCAEKYKDPFQAKVSFKIWLASNNEINIDASDEAAWGRLRIFKFPYSHINAPDIQLRAKLLKEKDGIFTWLCWGAWGWYMRQEKGMPVIVPQSTKEYLSKRQVELDSIENFLGENGIIRTQNGENDPGCEFIATATLYNQYSNWCDTNFITRKYSINNFSSLMRQQKGFETDMRRIEGSNPKRGFWLRRLSGAAQDVVKDIPKAEQADFIDGEEDNTENDL